MVEYERRNRVRDWAREVVGSKVIIVGGVCRESGDGGTAGRGTTITHTPQSARSTKTPKPSRAPHSKERRGTVDTVRIRTTRGERESRSAGDRDR